MLKREHLPHMLGAATLALMFSAVSVYPQTTTTGTSGTASTTGTSSTTGDARAPGSSGASSTATPSTSGASGTAQSSGNAVASSGAGNKSAGASGKAGASDAKLSKADQDVLRKMAISNLSEIEAGKLAQSKSQDEKVKAYAQQMIDDHTKAQGELEQLAQAKGVTLPKEPDAKHKAMAKKLSALEGEKFDKQYMAQGGVTDHRNTHKLLQKGEKSAKDPEVKALITKMIPTVDQHLQTAQQQTAGAKAASGKSSASSSSGGSGNSSAGSGSTGK